MGPDDPRRPGTGSEPTLRRSPARRLLRSSLALLLAWASSCAPDPGPRPPSGYNLVFVLSDALRASSLQFHGYERTTAPELGSLVPESVVFDNHLANFPGTPVSVSQMMTGRLMAPLLMDHSYGIAPVRAIEDDLLILPRALREGGYHTHLVSAHPWFNERARIRRFFDEWTIARPDPGEPYAEAEDLTAEVRRALAARASDGAPFFLYVHLMDTHGPFRPHEGFPRFRGNGRYPEVYDAYDTEILYTDHWIGWLVEELKHRGLLDRTIFVFTSDHGEELGEQGPEFWNRSHGYTVRRVQLHVPLLLRLPGGSAGGTRVEAMTNHLDVAPTLLRMLLPGADLERYRIDGRDLSERIRSGWRDEAPSRPTFAYTWRYWGLHTDDLELHYDQWRDEYTAYQARESRFNYPWSSPVEDPATAARLRPELATVRKSRIREFLELPSSRQALGRATIGVPTWVRAARDGSPTSDQSSGDDLWFQDGLLRLEVGPGERPGPITLAVPWAPGLYRVWVRISPHGLRKEFENRARLRIGATGESAVEIAGTDMTDTGLVDAGVHRIGRLFQVEVSEPRGGLSIAGFVLELQGADREDETAPLDPELEERLRALGYVD